MSRIGRKTVTVPSGVTAGVEGQTVKIKGPKGALQVVLHDDVAVKLEGGQIKVDPRSETKRARAQWGTSRTLINNLIAGVTKGFEQRLEINGVGYRAAVQGKNLQLALGYSHDVIFPIPEGITIATPRPVEIVISGGDLAHLLAVAAASSAEKAAREGLKTGANVDAAKTVGKLIAERAKEKGVKDVIFDRGGYLYHGRVRALAEAARESGLNF